MRSEFFVAAAYPFVPGHQCRRFRVAPSLSTRGSAFHRRTRRKPGAAGAAVRRPGKNATIIGLLLLTGVLVSGCGSPPSGSSGNGTVSVPAAVAAQALTEARTYLGVPYLYGGESRAGVDCSGLVVASYRTSLPSLSFRQPDGSTTNDAGADVMYRYNSDPIPLSSAQAGDLLFMATDFGPTVDHVALFESMQGNVITYVHASATAGQVVETTRSTVDAWWPAAFRGAGRLRTAL